MACEAFFSYVPTWGWLVIAAWFLAMELWGAFSRKEGDTFSEQVWAFREAGWARGIALVGLAAALCIRLYSLWGLINEGVQPSGWLAWGPWTSLALGLFGWLVVHFVTRGRHG